MAKKTACDIYGDLIEDQIAKETLISTTIRLPHTENGPVDIPVRIRIGDEFDVHGHYLYDAVKDALVNGRR